MNTYSLAPSIASHDIDSLELTKRGSWNLVGFAGLRGLEIYMAANAHYAYSNSHSCEADASHRASMAEDRDGMTYWAVPESWLQVVDWPTG